MKATTSSSSSAARADSYLRWPIDGGWAEESLDDKESWKRFAEVYPPESPPAQ